MSGSIHIVGVQFSTFTRAVQLCAEEIGIGYSLGTEVGGVDYGLRTSALASINPFAKVPVLLCEGRALSETQSICRYLDNRFNQSRLQTEDLWGRAQIDQWCAGITLYVDKAIVRDYLLEYLFPKGEQGKVRMDAVAAAKPEVKRVVALLEQQLGQANYLVDNQFSLADILLVPSLHYLTGAPDNQELVSEHSSLRDYVARIVERPSGRHVFV